MIPQFEPLIKEKWAEAVKQQILSGWIGNGPTVKKLEEKLAEYIGCKHVICCSSGSIALMAAIKALDLPINATIATPGYSFCAAGKVVEFLGYQNNLLDIKIYDLCMDPFFTYENDVSIYIQHNGKLGNLHDCKSRYIISDCAQGLGIFYNNKHLGTTVDIGTCSFSVPKIISGGQGGFCFTNKDIYAYKLREIIDQGSNTWREDGIHHSIGTNLKFNDISASYVLVQLEEINELLELRNNIHNRYLYNDIKIDHDPELNGQSLWMPIYRTKKAQELKKYLAKYDIQAKMYYKPNRIHFNEKILLYSEQAYYECLYLPGSLTLTNENINYICDIIHKFNK